MACRGVLGAGPGPQLRVEIDPAAPSGYIFRVSNPKYRQIMASCLKNLLPLQPGDVQATYADIDELVRDVGYRPETTIEEGLARFVDWYRDFYRQ